MDFIRPKLIEHGNFLRKLSRNVILKEFKKGQNIVYIADKADNILSRNKYISFPTSIEVNFITSNFAPIIDQNLNSNDIVSYTLFIKGKRGKKHNLPMKKTGIKNPYTYIPAKHAFSISLNGKSYQHLIDLVQEASIAGIKSCGPDVSLYEVHKDVMEVLDSYSESEDDGFGNTSTVKGIKSAINMISMNLQNPKKIIPMTPLIPPSMQETINSLKNPRMEEDEIYFIDVYGTNLPDHVPVQTINYPTMFEFTKFPDQKSFKNRKDYLMKQICRGNSFLISKNMNIYNKMSKIMGIGNIWSIRKIESEFNKAFSQKFSIDKFQQLHQSQLVKGYESKYVEWDYKNKQKRLKEIKEEKDGLDKTLNNSLNISEEEINEANIKRDALIKEDKELRDNQAISVHFGNTIIINDSPKKGPFTFVC